MPRRPLAARAAVLVLAATVLVGCRLEITAGADVDRDGSGTASLAVRIDRDLLAELDALGVDPTADLAAAVATQDPADGWTVSRRDDGAGGLVVEVARPAATPDELTAALRDLSSGLSEQDPALVVDLDLDVAGDGSSELSGTASLRGPAGPGLVGDPDAATADELAALMAEAVTATVAVTLPGAPGANDADEVVGTRLSWDVEVGQERTLTATAAAPTGPPTEVVLAAVGAGLVVVSAAALIVVVIRRRRISRAG